MRFVLTIAAGLCLAAMAGAERQDDPDDREHAAADAEPVTVWVEAQDADEADVTRHGWYDSLDTEQFSGGGWISHYDQDANGMLAYGVRIPRDGAYRFWVRVNPVNSEIAYRIGDEPWRELDMSDPIDRINVTADGAFDHRFIAWIDAGTLELGAGEHRITFRIEGGTANSGILDCFALTTHEAWIPRGTAQPGERTGRAAPGYFAWEPDTWDPARESAFDLRHLNENQAGEAGFVRRDDDGEGFTLGDGTPVRFWTVQAGDALRGLPEQRLEWWADRLTAYGVNLVRSGGTSFFTDWMRGDRENFERRLDEYHAMVAALKNRGIYVYINHLYWHTSTRVTLPEDVFPGFDNQHAIALLYFSEDFQDYYLEFLNELMTTANPYTGLPMAEDPAVAFLEIHNESNLLFHTFNPLNFVDTERELVERKFGDWLTRKYGSLDAASDAWGDDHPDARTADRFDEGRVGLYAAGFFRDEGWARQQRDEQRASDQLQFMAEAQKRFYERMRTALRQDVGVGQLIVPSNWRTADERILGALEHYTYTAADVVARNSYFSTDHESNERFYRVEPGDQYRDRSTLTMPEGVGALQHQTYAGYPYIITENNWNRPNRFRAEFPFLVAAYASLADIDGWLFFAMSAEPWDSQMNVWSVNDTSVLGQFPATALMYRRGDVQPGETVIHEALHRDDMFAFQGQAMQPHDGVDDPLYDRMLAGEPRAARRPMAIDPLAYYVGRVTRRVVDQPADSLVTDLRPYIDRQARTIDSITGELHWNYGLGHVTIDTPRAQGAAGFLGETGRIELGDVVIESDNEYAAILVIALDDRPLAESQRILIQAGTEDQTYGFEAEPDEAGLRTITRVGGYPLNVRKIDTRVMLKRDDLEDAAALDGNGYPTGEAVQGERRDGKLRLELPMTELYTLVQ